MDILQTGAELLREKLGTNADISTIVEALQGLLGGENGNVDIAGLVTKFTQEGGLQSVVSTWLGDGANQGIDASKIMDMFGNSQLGDFANKLGVGNADAANGLADVIPQMIDKASGGGSLLDSLGGAGGLMDAAKKFF